MKKIYVLGVVIVGLVTATILTNRFLSDGVNDSVRENNTANAIPVLLGQQTNSDSGVTITVTPIVQSDLSFEISLDTHSVNISEDLTKVAVLMDENGSEHKPTEWLGDPPGGHHRNGTLRFGEIVPQPQSFALLIRQIGGVDERKFEWPVKN
jgi:hypothetical protein